MDLQAIKYIVITINAIHFIICPILCSIIGGKKGRSYIDCALTYGLMLGLVGLIIVCCLPSKNEYAKKMKQLKGFWTCKKCGHLNKNDLYKCKNCSAQR